MFIIDSLLAAPVRGLLWVAEKIRQRADEERADDEAGIRSRLADLNRRLELGQIDEAIFSREEAVLIDRLERLWALQLESPKPSSAGQVSTEKGESDERNGTS